MIIALDVETSKSPNHFPWMPNSFLSLVCIVKEDGTQLSWLLNHPDCKQPHQQSIEEIRKELNEAKRIVCHNAKFELLWLAAYGIDTSCYKLYCTQVAEYLLRGQQGGRGELTLAQLSKDYGISDKIDKVKLFWDSGYDTDEVPSSILIPYCLQDCINTLAIYQRQVKQCVANNMQALFTCQMELVKVLAEIEYNGMYIDRSLAQKYSEEYGEKIADLDRRILGILQSQGGIDPTNFNINSGEQLSAALYGGHIRVEGTEVVSKPRKDGTVREYERKCKHLLPIRGCGFVSLPNTGTEKEGVYQTDLETLKSLKCKNQEQRDLIKFLIEKSRLGKLKSTYFDGLQEVMLEDGSVHPSFNQTLTKTGRLSCSKPNLQNQARGSTGPTKNIFITRYNSLAGKPQAQLSRALTR